MGGIGGRLRWLRLENQLSQEKMGSLLGVSGSYISMVERGTQQPSDQFIKLVAKQFYVREEWLRDGTPPVTVPLEELLAPAIEVVKKQGEPARTLFFMILAKAELLDRTWELQPLSFEDADLIKMMAYLRDVWASGDPDLRAWLKVQFRRAFPDYDEKKDQAAARDLA